MTFSSFKTKEDITWEKLNFLQLFVNWLELKKKPFSSLLNVYSFLFIFDKWASHLITVETVSTRETASALTLFETNRAIVLCL